MKTISKFKMMLVIAFLTLAAPTFANSTEPTGNTITNTEAENKAKAEVLIKRLEEIKEMSHSEKKELRKEVKAIKGELKATSGGVYLSVGAIIIIVLLLILIL